MKKRIVPVAIVLLTLFSLSACGNDNNNDSANNPSNSNTPNQNITDTTPGDTTTPNTSSDDADTQDIYSESRTQALKDAINTEVSQANETWVMVSGDMAYIALDIKSTDTAAETDNIKEEVSQIVFNTDSDITDVYISADADTLSRVKETFKDLANGKPISGLTAEITNMFTRITPTHTEK